MEDYRAQVVKKRATEADHGPKLLLFQIEPTPHPELTDCEKDLGLLEQIWGLKRDWDEDFIATNSATAFRQIEVEDMDTQAGQYQKKTSRLKKDLQFWGVWQHLKKSIDQFRNTMPLIENLRNDSMRPRHWEEIMNEINQVFDPYSNEFTLSKIFELNLFAHSDLVSRLTDEARKESKIESGLKEIEGIWKGRIESGLKEIEGIWKGTIYLCHQDMDLFVSPGGHMEGACGFSSVTRRT